MRQKLRAYEEEITELKLRYVIALTLLAFRYMYFKENKTVKLIEKNLSVVRRIFCLLCGMYLSCNIL